MNGLRGHCDDYLTVRRAVGYKLVAEARLLAGFVSFAERVGATVLTTDLAVTWTTATASANPLYLAKRMRAVRSFARYCHSLDPTTEVPPGDLFRAHKHRPTPYLFTDTQVTAVMCAARELPQPLRAATFETLTGLLAVTGLRICEAMRLDRDDLDYLNGVLIVRDSKFGKSREILVHDSTVEALAAYAALRDRLSPRPSCPSLFHSMRGTRLSHSTVQPTFRTLFIYAGLYPPSPACRPHIHSFRHTFAVNTLIGWYHDGGDVAARLPLLSAYLGHIDPAATYWYLSAAPELLGLAAERLELAAGGRL